MAFSAERSKFGKIIEGYIHGVDYQQMIEVLYGCWNKIGYSSEKLLQLETVSAEALLKDFKENLNAFVEQEKLQLTEMLEIVKHHERRVEVICRELNELPVHVDESLPLIDRSSLLKKKAEDLDARKRDRMHILQNYILTNRHLCHVLGHVEYDINTDIVPSQEQLSQFAAINTRLQHERDQRFKKFTELKQEIAGLMGQLEKTPASELERQLFGEIPQELYLLTDDSLKGLVVHKEELFSQKLALTEEIMQLRAKGNAIRNRLKLEGDDVVKFEENTTKICPTSRDLLARELASLEILKKQNIQRFIEELREEIGKLLQRCLSGSEERNAFTEMDTGVYDEESLQKHEKVCDDLRQHWNKNAEFFGKIFRREEVWKKKMELDEKEFDPARFNNRGGQLLRDQQEKIRVEHELKKLDTELAQKVYEWETENATPFKVYGKIYEEFLQEQRIAFNDQLERQKEERKKAKEQTGPSSIYGPPAKRKLPVDNHAGKDSAKLHKTAGTVITGIMVRSPKMNRVMNSHDL